MATTTNDAASRQQAAFFSLIQHPLKFRLYLLKNLPAAFFSGLRIEAASERSCAVSVPFKWLTQNPFRSTYFASLSMAAELSTGVLAMSQVYGRRPAVSMLVSGVEGRFYKKATGRTHFTCDAGNAIAEAVSRATTSGSGQEVKVQTVGKNAQGEIVADFWFTWTFKKK